MATPSFDDIQSEVQSAADGLGGEMQIAIGSPGSVILWPPDPQSMQEPQDTGQAWATDAYMEIAFGGVGAHLDKFSSSWASIFTNITAVAPTFNDKYLVDTVAKNELAKTITVTFNPVYATAFYYFNAHSAGTAISLLRIVSKSVSQVVFQFWPAVGIGANPVNSLIIEVYVCGDRG